MLTRRNKSRWEECTWGLSLGGRAKSASHIDERKTSAMGPIRHRRARTHPGDESPTCECRSITDLEEQHRTERRRTKSATTKTDETAAPAIRDAEFFRRFPFWSDGHRESDAAGRRIVALLMLHAWRRRREDNEEARAAVKILGSQVDSLKMQVYVLRQLLDNEKTRVALAGKDIQKNLSKIEEYEMERKTILKEKETLECEIKNLQDTVTDLKNKYKNQKNELATARLEAENWDNRLKKERKKLKILKDENAILLKEAQSREEQFAYQSQYIEELNQTNKKLQDELDAQVPVLNEVVWQMHSAENKLELSQERELQQEKALAEKEEEIKKLKCQIAALDAKLQEKDERNGELGKLISDKSKELMLLNEKLGDLTKSQRFWGNRVVRVASLCTRIPIACFYTMATLLLPQPSYRSL